MKNTKANNQWREDKTRGKDAKRQDQRRQQERQQKRNWS